MVFPGRGEAEQQQQVGGAEQGEELRVRHLPHDPDAVPDPGLAHEARHVHGAVLRPRHHEAASRSFGLEPRDWPAPIGWSGRDFIEPALIVLNRG